MSMETTIDLHGMERLPFPNWTEDATYLEAVTLTDTEAVELLHGEGFDTVELRPIHMRWAVGQDVTDAGGEGPEGWLECPADHPHAVPFWKDGP